MKWVVNIEGNKKMRILVTFEPQNELIVFHGQYKSIGLEWFDFSVLTHPMIIDLDSMKEMLEKVYNEMKNRIEAYDDLSNSFTILKNIEFISDDE